MVMGETAFVRMDNYPELSNTETAAAYQAKRSDGVQFGITNPLSS
jgi:hypothetical protein